MSDLVFQYQTDEEQSKALADALARKQKFIAGNTPAGLFAWGSPVGETEEGKLTYGLPGVANMIYSAIGRGVKGLTNLALKAGETEATTLTSPYTGGEQARAPQIQGELPGVAAAEKAIEDRERLGTRLQAKVLPPPTPETAQDLADAQTGKMVGEVGLPIPTGAYTAITRLASALKPVAEAAKFTLAPTPREIAPIAAASGAAADVIQTGALADEEKKKAAESVTPAAGDYAPDVVRYDLNTGQRLQSQTTTPETQPGVKPGGEADAGNKPNQNQQQSWITIPEAAGAGVVGLGGLWALTKFGGRGFNVVSNTLNRVERNLGEINRIIDAERAGRPITTSVKPGTTPNVPLPGEPARGGGYKWGTQADNPSFRAAQDWLNPNAVLNQTAKGVASNADEAKALAAHNNMVNYPAGQARQMETQFRTGISPTGRQGPSQYDMKTMVDAMTPQQRELANDAAWMRNELDNRRSNGGQRVNYAANDDATLQHVVARADQDPLVRAFLGHVKQTNQFIVDDLMRMGVVSRTEAARALANNPHYMPTFDIKGNLQHSWEGRIQSVGSGLERPALPAWEAQSMYYDQIYRRAIHDKFRQDWILRLEQFSKNNPEYRNLVVERRQPGIGHNQGPPMEGSLGPIISIPTPLGRRYFDVNNSTLRDALQSNATNAQLLPTTANAFRRWYQAGTTGPLAIPFGSVYAAKNFIRDALQIPTQATRGYKTGLGFIPGSAATGVRDSGAVLAKAASDALASKDHPFRKLLYNTMGGQRAEHFRQYLTNKYMSSNLERRTSLGVGGGGQQGYTEVSGRVAGASTKNFRDPLANVAPLVSRPKLEGIAEKVPLGKGTVNTTLSLRQLIHDLHGVWSDAPHSQYFDINVPNVRAHGGDMRVLANEVQRVIGDPTTHGIGRTAQAFSRHTPYFNTALQGVAKKLATVRDQPLRWAGTTAATTMMLALASQLTALVSGKEHTDHLENRVSNSKGEANTILYHGPGTDPNNHTELTVPQEHRMMKAFMDDVVGHLLDTWNAHSGEGGPERLIHAISDLFSQYTNTNMWTKVGMGAADEFGFPLQLPPYVNTTISALTGSDVQDPARKVVENLITGKSITTGIVSSGSETTIPGQMDNSSYIGKKDSSTIQAMLSGLLGFSGQALGEFATNAYNRLEHTGSLGWLWEGLKSDYGQKAAESNAYGNILFQRELGESTRSAGDERVLRAWDQIKGTIGAASQQNLQGMTRAGGEHILQTGHSVLDKIADPQMRALYLDMGTFGKNIEEQIMPQINDIYKQMQTVKDSAYTADEKRRMTNNLARDLSERRAKLMEFIETFNHHESRLIGRHVDVSRRIDWGRGIDQFGD